jgi:hypothetical protein
MDQLPAPTRPTVALRTLRWTARALSVLSISLLAAFLFGGAESLTPTIRELVALLLFPGGVVLGMLISWRREGLGAIVSIASLAALYAYIGLAFGRVPAGPYFILFTSPAALFGLYALLARSGGRKPVG